MRIDHDIGIYTEDYARMLKWYSWAKNPTKEDKKLYDLIGVIYNDLLREDKEAKEDE